MEYIFCNKNKEIALLRLENELSGIEVIDTCESGIPKVVGDIGLFISSRRPPKKRKYITELLTKLGCNTLKGYIDLTYCLSLKDTFWVKPYSSNIRWEEVSLFRNPYNTIISKICLEGFNNDVVLGGTTLSPEFGTDGCFAKSWRNSNGRIELYKLGSIEFNREPYSEYYANQIQEVFRVNKVAYDLDYYNNNICSVCECFTNEDTGYIAFGDIRFGKYTGDNIWSILSKLGYREFVRDMVISDVLSLNVDRHIYNFGFLYDMDTYSIKGMAPLFDNNMSLLPYMSDKELEDKLYVIESTHPSLDYTWLESYSNHIEDLIEVYDKIDRMRYFEFSRHRKYNLSDRRIRLLEDIVREQARRVIRDIDNLY